MAEPTEHTITVRVNGSERTDRVPARLTLVDWLRTRCSLTGTHVGCEHGVCGACTVLVDGEPTRGCLVLAVQADGAEVTTVEGLGGPEGALSPLQEAFRAHHGLQCGFCTPGFLVTLTAHLREHPASSDDELREAVSGNLCRCTGYQGILRAACAVRDGREGSL